MGSQTKKTKYHFPESFGAKFYELTPKTWSEAKEIGKNLKLHIFRGQSDSTWPLTTTLERLAKRFDCPPSKLWEREKFILKVFKSRAHHFLDAPPNDNYVIEWLSIIQDYGGPTRLLDFTASFYIATFFALESATGDACVWAVHNASLRIMPHVISATGDDPLGLENEREYTDDNEEILRYAESYVNDKAKSYDLALRITPPRLNERLAIQKGLFLFPCNLLSSFESNLCKSLGLPFENLISSNAINDPLPPDRVPGSDLKDMRIQVAVVKINLQRHLQPEAIEDLYSMNIDAASLFPGLDGFARSLNHIVQFPPLPYKLTVGVGADKTSESEKSLSSTPE